MSEKKQKTTGSQPLLSDWMKTGTGSISKLKKNE